MPTFASPLMAAQDWRPRTTTEVLGENYQAPAGGPSLDTLNASPVWRAVLSQLAGAPSTIPNSKDINTLIPNLLSGVQSLRGGYGGPLPEWATHTAPTPGQAGWVNPQWGGNALPGGMPPPQASTNNLGRTFFPSDTSPEQPGGYDPWAFGKATPGSWLDQSQKSFPQGQPSAPVVNQWQLPPNDWKAPRNRYGIGLGGGQFNQAPWYTSRYTP